MNAKQPHPAAGHAKSKRLPASLLRWPVWARLLLAAAIALPLWLATAWALSE